MAVSAANLALRDLLLDATEGVTRTGELHHVSDLLASNVIELENEEIVDSAVGTHRADENVAHVDEIAQRDRVELDSSVKRASQ